MKISDVWKWLTSAVRFGYERKIHALEAENDALRAKLERRQKVKYVHPFVYLEGEATAYCPKCWSVSEKLVNVTPPIEIRGGIKRSCVGCEKAFWDKPPQPALAIARSPERRSWWVGWRDDFRDRW